MDELVIAVHFEVPPMRRITVVSLLLTGPDAQAAFPLNLGVLPSHSEFRFKRATLAAAGINRIDSWRLTGFPALAPGSMPCAPFRWG
ncbi:MAG: hypothetical protein U0359_39680 [Byssovorax sp.]